MLVVIIAIIAFGVGGAFYYKNRVQKSGLRPAQENYLQPSPSQTETPSPQEFGKPTSQLSWKYGGVAIPGNYADAEIVALGNGRYRMYYSLEPEAPGFKGQVYSSISSDSENWIQEPGTRMEWATFPSVIKLLDGKFRMYYQNAGVIKSSISSDGLS